jgi:hypothetical protein
MYRHINEVKIWNKNLYKFHEGEEVNINQKLK